MNKNPSVAPDALVNQPPSPGSTEDLRHMFANLDGGPVGLCVSGGPDSLVMLHAASLWCELSNSPRSRFTVLTVDHALRPESAAEARFVAKQSATYNFEHHTLKWQHSLDNVSQNTARNARHLLLREAAAKIPLSTLCFAHTSDDFAETFLMRLSHGSGLRGLAGASPNDAASQDEIHIVRPLSNWSRADVNAFIARHDLKPVNDPSNDDTKYERVRTRRILRELGPLGLDVAAINTSIRRLTRADNALNQIASGILSASTELSPFGFANVSRKMLVSEPEDIQCRVIGALLTWVAAGNAPEHDSAVTGQLEALVENIGSAEPSDQNLRSCLLRISADVIQITREPFRVPPVEFDIPANEVRIFDKRFVVTGTAKPLKISGLSRSCASRLRKAEPALHTVPLEALAALPAIQTQDQEGNALQIPVFPNNHHADPAKKHAANRATATFIGKIPAPLR